MKAYFFICIFSFSFSYQLVAGNDWNLNITSPTPPARWDNDLAFIGNSKVLLFGGDTQAGVGSFLNDTWIFDIHLNSWTQINPTQSPTARGSYGFSYIGSDKVILFGGSEFTVFGDTWIYDLSTESWSQKSPTSSPDGRYSHAVAYFGGDQVLMYGV